MCIRDSLHLKRVRPVPILPHPVVRRTRAMGIALLAWGALSTYDRRRVLGAPRDRGRCPCTNTTASHTGPARRQRWHASFSKTLRGDALSNASWAQGVRSLKEKALEQMVVLRKRSLDAAIQ